MYGETLSHLEITEVVLDIVILWKAIISMIQESCIDLFLITFCQLLYIKKNIFFKTFNSGFPYIEAWFIDQI